MCVCLCVWEREIEREGGAGERKGGEEREEKKERIHKERVGHMGLQSFFPLLSVIPLTNTQFKRKCELKI